MKLGNYEATDKDILGNLSKNQAIKTYKLEAFGTDSSKHIAFNDPVIYHVN